MNIYTFRMRFIHIEKTYNAIDYYVKNISISGTVLTTGSPVAQQAVIIPAPTPVVAGVIPNTLKIQ